MIYFIEEKVKILISNFTREHFQKIYIIIRNFIIHISEFRQGETSNDWMR